MKPNKMPDSPNGLFTLLSNLPGPLQAFGAAIITAVLRVYYDKSETSWQRVGLEGALCACLATGLSMVSAYFGLPENSGVFIGTFVGFIGVIKFREYMGRLLDKKSS
jgi:lambda family phage holin